MRRVFTMGIVGVCLMWGVSIAQDHDKSGHDHSKQDHSKKDGDHAYGHDKGAAEHHEGEEDMKPVELTEHHKLLHDGVGTWKLVSKNYWHTSPEGEPAVSYGTCKTTPILDGLGVHYTVETTGDQGTFKGTGMATYNLVTKKYNCTWVDTYSYAGIDHLEGTYDSATKTMTYMGKWTGPDGMSMPYKMVEHLENKDQWTSRFYSMGQDGKEMMTMENAYTRAK